MNNVHDLHVLVHIAGESKTIYFLYELSQDLDQNCFIFF